MENHLPHSPKKDRSLLVITRIFSTLLALFFALAFIPKLISEYSQAIKGEKPIFGGWEGLIMEITFYVFFIGYIFSWWKKCTGGILILLASIIQMGPFLIIEGNLGSLIFGVPLVISGGLFLFLCRSRLNRSARL
jgi:hypothetical protein